APPPGPRASGSSTTPSTSTGTPQTTGKRSSRPTITPSDFHINHEGSRNGYTTPRDLTEGLTNSAISRRLFISEGGVEKHTQRVFAKLGLSADASTHRRVSAVLTLLQQG